MFVEHRQVVMGVRRHPNQIGHRQQAATTGDTAAAGGFQVLQGGGDDDGDRQPVVLTQLARTQHRPSDGDEGVVGALPDAAVIGVDLLL